MHEVKLLLMYDCDDWTPPTTRTRTDAPDPTANRAIYAVDTLGDKLDALHAEERELETLIGESLAIIGGVRDGFGEIYANLLEWHYIDGRSWTDISKSTDIKRSTCYYLRDIACDWVDSVGVSRLLKGEVDV